MRWFLKNWFLLGLIGLGLFAIPGVILVVLRLFEWDGEINNRLRENLSITYELRVDPWLALVLLFFPIILVILYFLKLKRKPIQVPSTFLWKKSIEDLHVNSLFQWLRNNVLLLLQLLALLFLIYSILGLRFHGSTERSRHYILLIDNSASMAVKDDGVPRLMWAKLEALKEIDAANDHDFGMVIVFNSKATTLQTYTNDRQKLREAVANIEMTQRPTRIEEALALAESLANPLRATEDAAMQPDELPEDQQRTLVQARGISTVVHLYSDGRFAKLTEAALAGLSLRQADKKGDTGGLNLHYHMAGRLEKNNEGNWKLGHVNNLGIVGLNVLKLPATALKKKAPEGTQQMIASVLVANFRSTQARVRVKLDVIVDGKLSHPMQREIEVNARKYVDATDEADEKDEPGEREARFELPPLDPRENIVLHATLDKTNDDFALDDQAWLAIGTTRKTKVLIIGTPNAVLSAFFDQAGTQKIATIELMSPEDLKTDKYKKRARSGEVDLVIFDRCAPEDEADMPLANTFFIDRPPPPWQRGASVLKNPLMMPSKQQQPLLRHLTTIWDVRTSEAYSFDVMKNLTAKAAEAANLPDNDPKKRVLPSITRIVETSNQVLILFRIARGPHTDLVMTFALMNDQGDLVSDWPLQPSFPLFMRNVLYIFGNVDDSIRAISVSPGEAVSLRPEAGFDKVELTRPDKSKLTIARQGDRNEIVFSDTQTTGVFRFRAFRDGDSEDEKLKHALRSFAVNLLDTNESNIEPRPFVSIGSERIEAGVEKFQTREIWKWILLLAVVLLVTEWFIYHRRIAV